MEILILARFIQGLGAGTIPPIAYVAIGRSLPEALRPRMFATLSTAWVLPGVMGPAIAGLVGETIGWRFVFLGLLPLIGLAGLLTITAVRAVPPAATAEAAEAAAASAERRRLPDALLVAAGAGLLMVGLTTGEPLLLVGLVGIGLVVGLPALRRLTPAGTLIARPILPAAILLRGILTCMFFGVDAYVTLLLEVHRGLSAIVAGVVLTAATLSWTAGSWIQARGADRWSTARFVQAGFSSRSSASRRSRSSSSRPSRSRGASPAFALAGLGMGLGYAPLSLITLREAAPEVQGSASSALSMSDTLGTALGTGVSGAIIAASLRSTGDEGAGLAIAFGVAIAVGLGGLALTTRLRAPHRVGTAAVSPSVGSG